MASLKDLANRVGQYFFNPQSNSGNNFWSTGVAKGLGSLQTNIQKFNQTPRFEFKKSSNPNPIMRTGINIAKAIPESIINIPRNIAVGSTRIGTEFGDTYANKRKINLQNLAGGVAPLAEGFFDIGTFGGASVVKGIAKGAGKEVLKMGTKQAIKQGLLKGAGYGAMGGLTYGLDNQYGKKFNLGEVAGNVAAGGLLGGVIGGGTAGVSSLMQLIKRPPKLDFELKVKANTYKGENPVKPAKMPKAQWEFQLKVNKELGRNPYEPVYPSDLQKIAITKGGLSVKKLTKFEHDQSVTKGSSNTQLSGDLQKDMQVLGKQIPGEIPTRTTANLEASSDPSVAKGQLNINKLNVDGAGKEVLEGVQQPVTVIGNKEVVNMARTAKGTSTLTDETMKKLMAQQLKNRQMVVDLTEKFNQAKANGAGEVELGKIMLEIADQSRTAQQGGTFAGRLLQAQNIIADQSASPMQKIFALLDNAGVKENQYLKDAVKVNWDNPTDVVRFYRKYVPAKLGELLDEFRYTNMLSSPLTHLTNIASNAIQSGIVAPIEKTITGTLDFGKALLTGSERKYYATAGIDYAGGYIKALPYAFKKAWNVLSGEEVSIRPDFEYIPTSTSGLSKAYTTPLRALEAMDQFFRTLVEGGVTNELKKGPQKLSNIKISDIAGKEANYRLFRQAFDPNGELGSGVVLRYFDKWNSAIGNLRRLPGGKWILPFLQTPTNILKQGVEFSPLGVTTAIGAKNPIEQISKALIGTTVFAGAYQLAKNGLTSWEAPSGEKERELYYAAGMQPYSVKMGDKWVSFSKLGPLSYPIAMAAALASAEKNNPDKSTVENVGKSVSGMLGFFGDQSYVRSIGDLVDAIQGGVNVGPSAISAEAANMAGQLIPYKSFMTWLGRITDPTYRKASTFTDRLIKDIPVVGSSLESYTDINGKSSVRDFPGLNAVSPFKITQEKGGAKGLLDQYQTKKIEKAVEKRADEEFAAGNAEQQVTGNLYRYIDENGAVKKIDLSFPIPEYKPTGKAILDKELLSDYRGAVTKQKNAVMKALEVGAITEEEAIAHLDKLISATNKSKKPKKISVKISKAKPVKLTKSKAYRPSKSLTRKTPVYKISKAKKPKNISISVGTSKVKAIKIKPFRNTLASGSTRLA